MSSLSLIAHLLRVPMMVVAVATAMGVFALNWLNWLFFCLLLWHACLSKCVRLQKQSLALFKPCILQGNEEIYLEYSILGIAYSILGVGYSILGVGYSILGETF